MMQKQEVYQLCRLMAPGYDFDPCLVLAICEQESNYDPHARRLEQRFFVKYTRNDPRVNDVDEILLAASWGLGQLMGESLFELGFIGQNRTIYDGLLYYLDSPKSQIDTACQWLGRKRLLAKGDQVKMLSLWNGDQTGEYAKQVLARYDKLKQEFK